MAAILAKVGALALKTLAKPLATRFQVWAMGHPIARKRIISLAQFMHRAEVYITRGAEGKSGKVFVAEMTEEKSLELAQKVASEGFIFMVGVTIIAFEYERQRRKDVAKKAQEAAERSTVLEEARKERERLALENLEQHELIHKLNHRVDKLEDMLTVLEENTKQKSKGLNFGGFFAPKGL